MNRPRARIGLLVWTAALLAVLWVGFGDQLLTHWAYAFERGRIQADSDQLLNSEELASLQTISKAFRLVAKVASPGVVNIDVSGGQLADGQGGEQQRLREQLRQQLGDMLDDEQIEQLLQRQQPPGSGSGIIFDSDGHILTNNHVVAGRDTLRVQLNDDRTYEATLVGTDPQTDLAVIKIEATGLHALTFGNSDQVDVGDWVLAVGAPFGLTQTVTHGIVSAKGRTRVVSSDVIPYQNFIQTDAAINPGNSGGPLLNLRGEVVGVNTMIATHGDLYNAGVAFTIPANMAVSVARELIASGQVARGWLGITYPVEPISAEIAEIFDLPNTRGILVTSVHTDSPANAGGLQVEDIIVEVNDEIIRDGEYFKSTIADIGPHQKVKLSVIRDRNRIELDVELGLQPRDMRAARRSPAIETRPVDALGLRAISLLPRMSRYYDETEHGVLIVALDENWEQNPKIKPGELIVACQGEPVENVGDLLQAIEKAGSTKRLRLQLLEVNGDRRIVNIDKRTGP
ncbi:MAG: trypsin-like peptidase domain-containing protein [Planctomycetota bacterium]